MTHSRKLGKLFITEIRLKSVTHFRLAGNTFGVFVKNSDILCIAIGHVIISSNTFGQNLATNAAKHQTRDSFKFFSKTKEEKETKY